MALLPPPPPSAPPADLTSRNPDDGEGDRRKKRDTKLQFVERLRQGRPEVLRAQFENCLFYIGLQWLAPLPDGRGFMRANLRRDVPRPVTNRFKAILDAIDAPLSVLEPSLACVPGSDKDDDRQTADLANRVLDYLGTLLELPRFKGELSKILVTCNNAYAHLGIDPSLGAVVKVPKWVCPTDGAVYDAMQAEEAGGMCPQDGTPLRQSEDEADSVSEGGMFLEAVTPFEIWVDYAVPRMEDQPIVMIRRLRPRAWAEAHWPEHADAIKNLPACSSTSDIGLTFLQSLIRLAPGGSPTAGGIGFGAPVRWNESILDDLLYVKPCTDYPEGLYLRMLGDELIVDDLPLGQVANEGTPDEPGVPFIPVVHYGYDNVPGTHVCTGPADHLKDLQRQRNRREAAIELYFQRSANGIWLIPEGTDVQTPSGEEGTVLRYSPLGSGGAKPERMEGSRLPSSFVEWLQFTDKMMEDISGCMGADVGVPCLDGKTRTMKQLAEEFPDGGMWVYGFDREQQRIVPAMVEKAWMTGVKRCVRVVLNEGEPVICTFDHPFLTWDRGYVPAEELKIDEAIVPLYVRTVGRKAKNNNAGYRYPVVLQPVDVTEESVGRMVACELLGLARDAGRSMHVHHRDENAFNNLPENLEVLTNAEHRKRHWAEKTGDERNAHAKKRWANWSPEKRKAMMDQVRASHGPDWKKKVGQKNRERWEKMTPEERKYAAGVIGGNWTRNRANHRVVRIELLDEREVYDLQTSTHNFGIDSGVFVHNTYDLFRGERPPNVSSGYAMQILTERAQARFAHLYANYEVSHGTLGKQMFLLFRNHAPEEIYFKIKGEEARWTVLAIRKADLTGGIDIRVEAGSARPRTPLEKKAAVEQALTIPGLIDLTDPNVRMQLLHLYGISELAASAKADDEQIAREHATLIAWARSLTNPETGEPDPNLTPEEAMLPVLVDPLLDNHPLHLLRHRTFMLTPEFLQLPDWVRQAFRDGHYVEHLYEEQVDAMQQAAQPAPPVVNPGGEQPPQGPPPGGGGGGAGAGAARAQGQATAMQNGGGVPGGAAERGQQIGQATGAV